MKVGGVQPYNKAFNGRNVLGREAIRLIPSSIPTDLEKSIEKHIGLNPVETVIKKFANGETYVNIKEDVRNKDVFLMPVTGTAINDNLMETYLKADAAKRMGANRVVAVMPNFPYGRQERKTELGEPISARLNLALLHASGVDEVITTDIHAAALQGFARQMKLTDLNSLDEMTNYFSNKIEIPDKFVVVSPDLGGATRADKFAKALGCDKAIIYKNRTAHNQAKAEMLLGDVEGKDCIIYDDIIDTAGTITEAAKMLKDNGAERIYIAASHGLFNGPALERLSNAPIEEVVVTNSERKPALDKIKQVDIAPKIVGTILDISG
jgi:ribose-phosphate pyrophosphokinase